MIEAILKLVHQGIRGDRTALRALIERYQGLTYALSFCRTKSFPLAQRVAKSAWFDVAGKLKNLTEPERFLELIEQSVDDAYHRMKPEISEAAEKTGLEGHSILRTDKVQKRRALRQALALCSLRETPVFFLRYVEGLSLSQIAELYGVELPAAVSSLKAVCVELAYRSGYINAECAPPNQASMPESRFEALGFAVDLVEGSLPQEKRARYERLSQTDSACRKEHEGVQTVLALATGTFSAHQLPPDFVKEILLDIPHSDPVKSTLTLAPDRAVPKPPERQRQLTDIREGQALFLSLASALASLILLLFFFVEIVDPVWGRAYTAYRGNTSGPSIFLLTVGGTFLALMLARPPLFSSAPKLPLWYYLMFGLTLGIACSVSCLLAIPAQIASGTWWLVIDYVAPVLSMAAVILVWVRGWLALADLERRMEARLTRIEEVLPHSAIPAVHAAQSHESNR